MCGIVGYIGERNTTEVLLDGLKRLEYRGYDSAGIAVRDNGDVKIIRNVGKLQNLVSAVMKNPPKGRIGIGHTRWATHGRPSEVNAHPHRAGDIILVHNGIIENHVLLRKYLAKRGHHFESETDTELACHLISDYFKKSGDMLMAIKQALTKIEGSYAFVIMNAKNDQEIFAAKKGSPMVIGVGEDDMLIASDIPAVLPYTKKVIFLEDGDVAVVTRKGAKIEDKNGRKVSRKPVVITWDPVMAEKGGYKHFMLKEIFEQPKVMAETMAGRISITKMAMDIPELKPVWGTAKEKFPFVNITIIACGTSWHAALVGKYWIEKVCRVRVSVELASEFRYRDPIIDKSTLVMAISQSGETADTLAAVKLAKVRNAKVISICNVMEASIPRASDATLYTHAGPEIGVASTKAFTAQLIVLLMFTLALGQRLRKVSKDFLQKRVDEMLRLPGMMKSVLSEHEKIQKLAEKHVNAELVLFIGRGVQFPLVLEGALKLKEISYTHAEGFAAGELKHGPIALVDYGIPVVAIVSKDESYDKVMNNVEEVQARGGDIIALAMKGDKQIDEKIKEVIKVPAASSFISPLLYAIPLQLFAYYLADHKGTDVDQPRNLAKSVTVE